MSHIVFFSYANKDLDRYEDPDPYLRDFFKDLCWEISLLTEYSAEDSEISFRDKANLRIMENWSTSIASALQASTVLVCITSVKYFNSKFCGKEYYVFDRRRRQGLAEGQVPPPVILPVIWAPATLPDFMNEVQQVPEDLPDSYRKKGLRDLARFDKILYERCVAGFARAIVDASKKYAKKIKPLDKVPDFDDVPNAFAGGKWKDAVGPDLRFARGPEVANFIFVAESKDECPDPEGRYGADPSQWRPYFPDKMETVLDHAMQATSKQYRFREIPVNNDLPAELEKAQERQNLSIVIGDPKALPLDGFRTVRSIEQLWLKGSIALLAPCHAAVAPCADKKTTLKSPFPVISQIESANISLPRDPAELRAALDKALFEMRMAVMQREIDSKGKTGDPPPPGLSGSVGART